MRVLILSDIFGRTPAFEKLCEQICPTTQLIDPYNGRFIPFTNEQEAYEYFIRTVGLSHYQQVTTQHYNRAMPTPTRLIGFSVGASVLWELACHQPCSKTHSIGFYGAQIRHSATKTPLSPIELIHPCHETHFSIEQMIATMGNKQHVTHRHTPWLHGFMNGVSTNFNNEGYQEYVLYLQEWIARQRH